MKKGSSMARCLFVLSLISVIAISSSTLPVSAAKGQKFLKKSAYSKGEGIFATQSNGPLTTPSVGAMGSGPIELGQLQTMATLNVPAGRYAIFAKTWVQRQDSDAEHVHCALVAEGVADHARTQTGEFDSSLALELAHSFDSAGNVTLECANDASGRATLAETILQHTKIIAIRAPSLTS
jgi:hypothetical protein